MVKPLFGRLFIRIKDGHCFMDYEGREILTSDLYVFGSQLRAEILEVGEPVSKVCFDGLLIEFVPDGAVAILWNGKRIAERDFTVLDFIGPDLWRFEFAYADVNGGPRFEMTVGCDSLGLRRKFLEIQKECPFLKIV